MLRRGSRNRRLESESSAPQTARQHPETFGMPCRDVEFSSLYGDIHLRGWYIPASASSREVDDSRHIIDAATGAAAESPLLDDVADRLQPSTSATKRPQLANSAMKLQQPKLLQQANGTGNAGRRLVIFAHGYAENRERNKPALPLAKALYERGISSLLFDFRNSGLSDASVTSVGHFETYDLLAALKWGVRNGYTAFAFVGFSMGASTAIVAAAHSKRVKAVVADSPFSDLKPYLKENMRLWTKLPNFPFTPLILKMISPLTGIDPDKVRPIRKIVELKHTPILLIHNAGDPFISADHSRRLYTGAELRPNCG